jgi:hypothetical protein
MQGQAEARAQANSLFLVNEEYRAILMSGGNIEFPIPNRTMSSKLAATLLGLFFIILAGLFLVVQQREIDEAAQIDRAPLEVDGRVTRLETDNDPENRTYYVHYQFRSGNETLFTARQDVSSQYYRTLQNNQTIRVRYYAENPSISELIDSPKDRSVNLITVIFGIVFMGIGIATIVMGWRSPSEQALFKEFNEKGTLIIGRIQSIKAENDSEGDYEITISYSFTDPDHRNHVINHRIYNNTLRGQPLPPLQTPVLVAYLNSKQFKLV